MQPDGNRALDRILAPDFVAHLDRVPMNELRARREQAQQEESWLSYVRRMLHGRIDILSGEGLRTPEGDLDLQALIDSLSGQMGPGNQPPAFDVVESPSAGQRAVERLIARTGLEDPDTLTAEQRQEQLEELRAMESEISQVRRQVHEVQDLLARELADRYKAAGAEGVLRR